MEKEKVPVIYAKDLTGGKAFIRVRVRTGDGTALASEMIPCQVEDVLKDGA